MGGWPASDVSVRDWVVGHQAAALVHFFAFVSRIGVPRDMYLLAAAGAIAVWRKGVRRGAAGVALSALGAVVAYETLKRLVGRARPPGLGLVSEAGTYSFPSAHATASAAVCAALAYVCWREGFVNRFWAVALGAGVPALVGTSRVYLDAHWASDVVAGWAVGALIAAMCVSPYERQRRWAGAAAELPSSPHDQEAR